MGLVQQNHENVFGTTSSRVIPKKRKEKVHKTIRQNRSHYSSGLPSTRTVAPRRSIEQRTCSRAGTKQNNPGGMWFACKRRRSGQRGIPTDHSPKRLRREPGRIYGHGHKPAAAFGRGAIRQTEQRIKSPGVFKKSL